MSLPTRWTEENTLKLIKLYKSYRFLWDPNMNLYKSYYSRKKAYDAMLEELDVPGLTIQDIRCKIKNLRTSYYQERRKMASHKMSNKIMRPLKWFIAFQSIMCNRTKNELPLKEVDPILQSEEEFVDEEDEEQFPPDEDQYPQQEGQSAQEESFFSGDQNLNSDTYIVSIKQEFLDEMVHNGDKTVPPQLCDYLEPVQQNRKEHNEHKRNRKRDEFQIFANNIAQQLRTMPLNRALKLQIEVQSMIARERIDALQKDVDENPEDSYDNIM